MGWSCGGGHPPKQMNLCHSWNVSLVCNTTKALQLIGCSCEMYPRNILHRPVSITFLQTNTRTNVHSMHVVQLVSKGRLTSHDHHTLPHHPGLRQPCHENPQPLETHPKPKKKQLTSLSNSCSLLLRCCFGETSSTLERWDSSRQRPSTRLETTILTVPSQ